MKTMVMALALCLLGFSMVLGAERMIDAELKFINMPTFRTGEAGPLWGRVVLTFNSDDLEPARARISVQFDDGPWQEGEWTAAWPGVPADLPVAITLPKAYESTDVLKAKLRVELGEGVVLSRLLDISIRDHGMYYRTYRSTLDDAVYPYALYLPAGYDATGRAWPLVVSLHGAYSNHANNLKRLFGIGNQPGESDELVYSTFPAMPELPPLAGIVLCPWGRGTMSYHGPGARDVLDVLKIVEDEYSIDPERVALTGLSMGGNGSWEIGLRNPGIFSSVAPVCPPADMNLSEFYTNVLSPLGEKFPFVKQVYNCNQIINWVANAKAYPVHIYHGNDDPVVPVEHSHRMVKALAGFGIEATLSTFDNVGHNAWDPAYVNGETLRRLMGSRRDVPAPLIEFTTCRYENARYQWLEITKFESYGEFATITAGWDSEKKEIRLLKTGNIAGLALYPDVLGLEEGERVNVRLTGGNSTRLTVTGSSPMYLSVGRNKISKSSGDKGQVRKRKGLEGPIWEALSDRVLLVYGTGPGGKETLRQTLKFVNWGYLPDTHFLIRSDQEVSDEDLQSCHLVLFGDEKSNKLIGRINDKAPVSFDGSSVVVRKSKYARDEVSVKCVFPNPLAPGRLVMLNYGEEWDYSKLWSFNGVFKTLPDYLVYKRGGTRPYTTDLLEAGFFGDDWGWK